MATNSNNSDAESSATGLPVSPTLKQDTYLVLNPLTPSESEWLMQQRLRVAEVFRRSGLTARNPEPG